jgi:transposase
VDLPSVHIPKQSSRELKTMCGMREALVQARTKLINTVRGWMRANATRVRRGGAETFGARVRAHFGAELPAYVDRQVGSIEHLTREIREADRMVTQFAKRDALCRRLMTVPGVGPVTALRFVSAIDEITRFSNAHAVEAYVGLVPGECSSSDRKHRTSITKAGSPKLRWALIQAAWAARRCAGRNLDPMVQWSHQVELRRGKRIAIVALARKIAGILYAMWRDGSAYEPLHSLGDKNR